MSWRAEERGYLDTVQLDTFSKIPPSSLQLAGHHPSSCMTPPVDTFSILPFVCDSAMGKLLEHLTELAVNKTARLGGPLQLPQVFQNKISAQPGNSEDAPGPAELLSPTPWQCINRYRHAEAAKEVKLKQRHSLILCISYSKIHSDRSQGSSSSHYL